MSENSQSSGVQPVQKQKKHTALKTRTLTAVVYVIVWVAMVALKWCVPQGGVAGGWGAIGFDAVFCAISVIGAFELLRAINGENGVAHCEISLPQRAITIAFCAAIVPLYALVSMIPETTKSAFWRYGWRLRYTLCCLRLRRCSTITAARSRALFAACSL